MGGLIFSHPILNGEIMINKVILFCVLISTIYNLSAVQNHPVGELFTADW